MILQLNFPQVLSKNLLFKLECLALPTHQSDTGFQAIEQSRMKMRYLFYIFVYPQYEKIILFLAQCDPFLS